MTGISLQLSWGNQSLFNELLPGFSQGAFLWLFESPQKTFRNTDSFLSAVARNSLAQKWSEKDAYSKSIFSLKPSAHCSFITVLQLKITCPGSRRYLHKEEAGAPIEVKGKSTLSRLTSLGISALGSWKLPWSRIAVVTHSHLHKTSTNTRTVPQPDISPVPCSSQECCQGVSHAHCRAKEISTAPSLDHYPAIPRHAAAWMRIILHFLPISIT